MAQFRGCCNKASHSYLSIRAMRWNAPYPFGGITLINCFPSMGFDIHLIANFGALALITLAGPAVIFILFYRRGAL
jgi:hypothetical protein